MDNIKPEVKQLSDQDKAQAFVKDYEQICEKHQLRIVTTPAWRARDDGTFSLILTNAVGKLPKQE
jgi:hypothetical protein